MNMPIEEQVCNPFLSEAVSTAESPIVSGSCMEASAWRDCRFLTCSVLPVRLACNCSCPFCFSRSSISALRHDPVDWGQIELERYFEFACERGASRLVVTGGGEPFLRAGAVLDVIRRGKAFFDEIACFTNGSLLTRDLARQLASAGLSYLCYSRHHYDDLENAALMGDAAPPLGQFFKTVRGLSVRATCVMTRGNIDNEREAWRYIERLAQFGVTQFTFKHTYVAYERSVFAASAADRWAGEHRVDFDPFAEQGEIIGKLPWGPAIRRIGKFQVCYYHEPTPAWEQEHQICRSVNLLSDGTVFASLEDQSSRLFRLSNFSPL
jgi:pyruvate-formate lyase-activating enzyme